MLFRLLRVAVCALPLLSFTVCAQNESGYSTKQRISRIRQLGKSNPQAIATLEPYLTDPSSEIRNEAVKAIVKLGTERSLAPLMKATADKDTEVQIRATDGLVNFYLPGYVSKGGAISGSVNWSIRQVKSYFSSRNEQTIASDITVRTDVAEAIGDEIVHSSSLDGRANAARAAGILRAEPTVPALSKALRSKDSELIFEALVALQKIADPTAGPSVSFLARDLDNRVQETALETIGVLHSVDSAPDVRLAVSSARTDKIRRAALEALAMLGLPDDRAVFKENASNTDPFLRSSALEGLGRIREPEDTPLFDKVYNEPNADWKVHIAAAFGLVNEGKVDTADFSPLRYLFENLDVKSRQNVASAYLIELCRREDVRKGLYPLMREATSDQKIAICHALSRAQGEDVVTELNVLLKDINPDVSLAASRSLKTVQAHKPE